MDLGDGEVGDIPTRPMRVKILYTFDQDNKTNCLARFPDVLQIPAVAIDETSQVGVIELQQCLQAVVAASPELLSRLSDGDFTIYAYDYSEYETPLVGQGMLSAALVATSTGQQNKTMITGRVCKNVLGLFNNGVKETLEVKLRLVPVPKPAQSEVVKSLDMMRSMSPAMSGGFDPNAWSASMQQSKPQQHDNDYFNLDALIAGGNRDMAIVDDIFGLGGSGGGQQMTGGVGIAETPTDAFNPAFAAHPHSAPGSRAGSPMIDRDPSRRNDMLRHQSFSGNATTYIPDQSRPGSRASVRSESHRHHQRQASTPSYPTQQQAAQQNEVYYNEDGQPRKRAKVQQADWHGRSSFGSKSGDLRVTAATAASMHMHRPIPKRPCAPGSNLEPPPRVPTPVPQRMQMPPQQQLPAARRSMLRQASQADSDYMSDMDNYSDALVSSPDEESPDNSVTAEGTPVDIPSSPPVFPGITQPTPSSPGLPTLPPRMADSGYMSERGFTSSNAMENMEQDEDRSPDAFDFEMAAQYRARNAKSQPIIKIEGDSGGSLLDYDTCSMQGEIDDENSGSGALPRVTNSQGLAQPYQQRNPNQAPSPHAQTPAPRQEAPSGSRRGSLALPPIPPPPSSDLLDAPAQRRPAAKKRRSMHRSRIGSNESEPGSPAPSDTESVRPTGTRRSGSGAHRRKLIEERLQKAIANGETPQFCAHCGSIETPTWRRLYVLECNGKPSPLDAAEGEGETIGIEVTETNEETNQPTKYIIRKSMKKTKSNDPGDGFRDIVVCNPCGLWFNKFKAMRPPDKWGNKSGRRNRKNKKAAVGTNLMTDGIEPQSEAFFTDMPMPDDADDEVADDADGGGDRLEERPAAPARSHRPRANSLQLQQDGHVTGKQGQWNASRLDRALARAVQSSPVLYRGSQASPIEVEDLTPKPTRRILFPSPRKDGEVKSLDDNAQVSLKAMPPDSTTLPDKAGLEVGFEETNANIYRVVTANKENMAPPPLNEDGEDDLSYLFNGSPSAIFKTPLKTPAKKTITPPSHRQVSHLLRTPTPSRSGKRKALTPNQNAANNANVSAAVNDFMTSPSSTRYFLRSTPSRLERTGLTPGRSLNGSNGVSPWSHHLAQIMSDPNDAGNEFASPSRGGFDFSELPAFTTPGGRIAPEYAADWEGLDGILSSEFAAFGEEHRGEGAERAG